MLAAEWKQMMERMYDQIEKTLIANLKIAAIRIIQMRLQQIMSKATGGSSQMGVSGMIISNWEQFIYGTANQYAMNYTNNFFDSMSSGATGYVRQYIIMPAKMAVMTDPAVFRPNIQNYVNEGRADMIFQPGWAQNPKVAWLVSAQPQNDPGYWALTGTFKSESAYNRQVEAQKAQGIAGQGYASGGTHEATTSTGTKVTVPAGSDYQGININVTGSYRAAMASKVESMGIDMVALARSIPEVVASMVTQVITQTLTAGIQNVASQLGGQSTSMGSMNMNYGAMLNSAGTSVMMGTSSQIQRAIQQGLK
jgi:hypothetical protein